MRIRGSELRKIIKEEISRLSLAEQDIATPSQEMNIAYLLSGKSISGKIYFSGGSDYFGIQISDALRERTGLAIRLNETKRMEGTIKVVVNPEEPDVVTFDRYSFFRADVGTVIPPVLFVADRPMSHELALIPREGGKLSSARLPPAKIMLQEEVEPGSYTVKATYEITIGDSSIEASITFPDLARPIVA